MRLLHAGLLLLHPYLRHPLGLSSLVFPHWLAARRISLPPPEEEKPDLSYAVLFSRSLSPSSPFSNAGLTPPWSQSFHCHASGNLTMSFRANDRRCSSSLGRARVRPRRDYGGQNNKNYPKGLRELFIALKYVIDKRRIEIGDSPRNIPERRWDGVR